VREEQRGDGFERDLGLVQAEVTDWPELVGSCVDGPLDASTKNENSDKVVDSVHVSGL